MSASKSRPMGDFEMPWDEAERTRLEHCKREAARYGVQQRHWERVADNVGISAAERDRRRALAWRCGRIAMHLEAMAELHTACEAEKQAV